jgi:hypothetical protein
MARNTAKTAKTAKATATQVATTLAGTTGPAPTGNGRGGARAFGTGKQQRTKPYTASTVGASIHAHCAALAAHLGVPLAPLALVVQACTAAGINPASARAGYTHYKQLHGLNIKAGRPTPAQVAAMATYKGPAQA